MLADGLLDRFPCDEIYGLHNSPNGPKGGVSVRTGAAMAAADFFDIRITGRGSHAAHPHEGVDPVVVSFTLGQAMQSIVSRNVDPLKSAVLSITQIHAGAAYNVIPDGVHLAGTIRTFDDEVRRMTHRRIRELADGIAKAYGATVNVDIRETFSVLHNSAEQAEAAAAVARELFGEANVNAEARPKMGSEDFADMLQRVPGAYLWVGQRPGPALHNAEYDFDDDIIPVGASLLARLVEKRGAAA
jgi:hippurate hydrolase